MVRPVQWVLLRSGGRGLGRTKRLWGAFPLTNLDGQDLVAVQSSQCGETWQPLQEHTVEHGNHTHIIHTLGGYTMTVGAAIFPDVMH